MQSNHDLITRFYESFQKKDYKYMQDCYAGDAVFNDEVFVNLNASEVKAMWEMLCTRGKDLQLQFSNINADEQNGSADWEATYTFSKTGRKVVNSVQANFSFVNGKIVSHTDKFNFYRWSSQALGVTGVLLGWTSFLKTKVRTEAKKNLKDFMGRK